MKKLYKYIIYEYASFSKLINGSNKKKQFTEKALSERKLTKRKNLIYLIRDLLRV